MSERLEIACAVQGARYVAHNAVMLRSLLVRHTGRSVRVHLAHGGDVTRRQQLRMRRMVEDLGGVISFIEVPDAAVEGLPTTGFTRKATWYRVLLPDLLSELDRVLYLDSDLLVMDDLGPLYATPLGDHDLGAVSNVLEPMYSHRPAELGLPASQPYFNAGVLLLDLAVMRSRNRTDELLRYGRKNADDLLWRDQDALNVVLGASRLPLHPRWNCMNIFGFPWATDVFERATLQEAIDDPAIRHFEGPDHNKPWHLLCGREERSRYAELRRGTPWPRYVPSGLSPKNVLRWARRSVLDRRPARVVGPVQ